MAILEHDLIPKDLPEYGELDGRRFKLDGVWNLTREERERVIVEMPHGKVRPWRFIGGPESVTIADDGTIEIA